MTKRVDRLKLLVAAIVMAIIWLVFLPRISKWQPIRTMIETHEAAGIDPSAMFYSDVEHLAYRDGMLRRKP